MEHRPCELCRPVPIPQGRAWQLLLATLSDAFNLKHRGFKYVSLTWRAILYLPGPSSMGSVCRASCAPLWGCSSEARS
jgi:hypothetical protein